MTGNVTIRLDENMIKKCRHAAVEEDKSLSRWIADVLVKVVFDREAFAASQKRALARLEQGFRLGGRPLMRKRIHER